MTSVIVADRMTGNVHLSVYLNAIYDAFMRGIFSRFAGVISRNRSSYGSTDTRTDDRTFAPKDFGANRTTQGAANAATNGRIKRLIVAGASREAEQQAYREEQTLEFHLLGFRYAGQRPSKPDVAAQDREQVSRG